MLQVTGVTDRKWKVVNDLLSTFYVMFFFAHINR